MVRQYKRKRPRQWSDKDKRMKLAARMRAEGKSLREIAAVLGVSSPQTVLNDLNRWDAQQSATPSNVIPLSKKASKSVVQSCPPGGEIGQADWTKNGQPITTGEALGLTVQQEAMARAIASMTDRRRTGGN